MPTYVGETGKKVGVFEGDSHRHRSTALISDEIDMVGGYVQLRFGGFDGVQNPFQGGFSTVV
jgi:peptidyl-tRNA hydrolase